jgi:FkbM family methyltransferase
MSYSQLDEEEHILRFFGDKRDGKKRRFLDIGAHDGVSCSNTRRLAELGWGGTLVEPSPSTFTKLMALYSDRDDVNLVNAGIVPYVTCIEKFYESGTSFVGTFDKKHRDEWEGKQHVHYNKIYVVGVTWEKLFITLPGPYSFVSIDAEGTNFEILEKLYYPQWNGVELICVEHQGRVEEIEKMMRIRGFECYHVNETNILLAVR